MSVLSSGILGIPFSPIEISQRYNLATITKLRKPSEKLRFFPYYFPFFRGKSKVSGDYHKTRIARNARVQNLAKSIAIFRLVQLNIHALSRSLVYSNNAIVSRKISQGLLGTASASKELGSSSASNRKEEETKNSPNEIKNGFLRKADGLSAEVRDAIAVLAVGNFVREVMQV